MEERCFWVTPETLRTSKLKSNLDSFCSWEIGVSFPHIPQPDSIKIFGEMSLQKPWMIVCCNSRDGGCGGNSCFWLYFWTAVRWACLYAFGSLAWYFCTSARLACLYCSEYLLRYFKTAFRLDSLLWAASFSSSTASKTEAKTGQLEHIWFRIVDWIAACLSLACTKRLWATTISFKLDMVNLSISMCNGWSTTKTIFLVDASANASFLCM